MIPGASLFLYLLPLAAAPVLFHLLMRRQRKTVLFSTRMFFDSMKPRLSFHRKFREPLLLAARTLLLLFLLLALARLAFPGMGNVPGVRRRTGGGDCHRQLQFDGGARSRAVIEPS